MGIRSGEYDSGSIARWVEWKNNTFLTCFRSTRSEFTNDGSVQDSTRHKLNRALLQLPGKGDFDLRNVLDSVYFFS